MNEQVPSRINNKVNITNTAEIKRGGVVIIQNAYNT